jgi:hypothetical protein
VIRLLDSGQKSEAVARHIEETGCDVQTAMEMLRNRTGQDLAAGA